MTHPRRRVFYSFHYDPDVWRTQQVRQARALEGNTPVTANAWEQVKLGGDRAIRNWIDDQLSTRSCLVVLVGTHTAERRWVDYEIDKAWELGKGVVGVRIHQLKDQNGLQSSQGGNPFVGHTVRGSDGRYYRMDNVVKNYKSDYSDSQVVYNSIVSSMEDMVEEAISIRNGYP